MSPISKRRISENTNYHKEKYIDDQHDPFNFNRNKEDNGDLNYG
jgi:hypothetical protein